MTTFAFAVTEVASLHPTNNSGNPIHGYHRALGNAPGRIVHAQHHRHSALAGKRCEMRGAASEFRDYPGHPWQYLAERGSRHRCDQHLAWRDPFELAFAIHHARAPSAPAYSRRVPVEA